MAKTGFTRSELGLVGTAALLVFSRVFGLSVVLPNFREHYEAAWTVDPFWIGVAFSAYGLTVAAMQFPNGVLSDRFGRRPLLWTSSAFFVGGSLLAAFATSPSILIAARLLQGMGAVASVAVAAVGETLPAERRTTGMALVGIPAGTGFLLGMVSGALLYNVISMQGLFILTAAIGALAALPLLKVAIPTQDAIAEPPKALTFPVAALALGGFAANYVMTTTLFFLREGTSTWLPLIMLPGLLVMLTLGRRIDRFGWTWQPITVGLAFFGMAGAMFALAPAAGYWIGGMMFFVFHAAVSMSLPSQVSRIAGPSGGRGHGIQNVIAYGGTFLAGPVAGYFAAQSEVASSIAVAVALLAAVTVYAALRTPQTSNAHHPEAEPGP